MLCSVFHLYRLVQLPSSARVMETLQHSFIHSTAGLSTWTNCLQCCRWVNDVKVLIWLIVMMDSLCIHFDNNHNYLWKNLILVKLWDAHAGSLESLVRAAHVWIELLDSFAGALSDRFMGCVHGASSSCHMQGEIVALSVNDDVSSGPWCSSKRRSPLCPSWAATMDVHGSLHSISVALFAW